MEGSKKVLWQVGVFFLELALQEDEKKKLTSICHALFFILTLCTGKNA